MNRIGIKDFRLRGFAVGIASMGLNALVNLLLVPLAATLSLRSSRGVDA